MISKWYIKIVMVVFLFLISVSQIHASDTMLMFVGEDLDVLSIASRKEESAWNAPAIAKVITNKNIQNSGALTIAQALDDVAGFYVEETNQGSIPYLRGISSSALILYDTVPIGSGSEKTNHMIDYETSLASVKRIEIIRGAGSVLWGPDAFAGVVNVVPLTGRDFSGIETGVTLSSAEQGKQAYLRYGKDNGNVASFLSFSARHANEDDTTMNVLNFWNDGVTPSPIEHRYGSSSPNDSHYLELSGNMSLSEWLVLSAKLSQGQKAFSVADWENNYIWEEQKSYDSMLFKLEASKDIGIDSGLRFTGYFSEVGFEKTIIDRQFDQKEYSVYGELIYEQSLFQSDALLTIGTSYREDRFKDILIWDNFYPGYLVPENQYFLPEFFQEDYENKVFSAFGQYRHKIDDIEFWIGFRNDDHEKYEDKISFSSGLAWSVFPELIVKASYGSGYRTPSAKQLYQNTGSHLEQIKNYNLQLQYKPSRNTLLGIAAFRNDIDNHVVGDRYEGAGVSLPNSQTIDGVELEWDFKVIDRLSITGNATFLWNDGPDETFLYNDYTYFDDDGVEQKNYVELAHNYDTGSTIRFNLQGDLKITDKIRLIPQIEYFSERELYYSVGNETREYPGAWLCNLRLKLEDIKSCDIDLFVNNIFENKYKTFDTAADHSSESISVGITVRHKW
jgi:outer membrane cobalamin receptor